MKAFMQEVMQNSQHLVGQEVRQLHKVKVEGQLGRGLFLFGENMEGIHSIEYNNLDSYFYIFWT
jgi:hypothetical protein